MKPILQKNKLTTIILIAFLVRLILLFIQYSGYNLPQAGKDTVRLERWAFEMIQGYRSTDFIDIINNGAQLHCYIGYLIYSVIGRVPIIWSFLYLLMGLGTIFNIHKVVFLITNSYKLANRSAWIACFFPNMAIFSVILLREAPIHFFISLAVLYLVKYMKFKSSINIILFLIYGLIGSVFHSGVFSLFIGFLIFTILFAKKMNVFSKVLLVGVTLVGLYYINTIGIGLNKFGGSFEGALEGALDGGGGMVDHGGSNYPDWLVLKGGVMDIFLIPIRIVAFLFAPLLPFLVRTGSHLLGLIDASVYLYIVYNIFKNKSYHINNNLSKMILIIVFTMSLAFSFGASNFGTNIRHRAKVLPILLMLPLFSKAEHKKIKRLYK